MGNASETPESLVRLSRTVSHALRHEPEAYGLNLDPQGWVLLDDLVQGLRQRRQWRTVTVADVETMVAESVKPRYEIDGERIRARYGHSTPERIERTEKAPPARLYHGTSPAVLDRIMTEGLRPMQRQSVHLAARWEDARTVGRRKAGEPVVLQVDTTAARDAGVAFFLGHEGIWLADAIPPTFLKVSSTPGPKSAAGG